MIARRCAHVTSGMVGGYTSRVRSPLRPFLAPGADYWTVLRNLSRLVRAGVPLRAACDRALEHAGLTRFPRRPPSPTVH